MTATAGAGIDLPESAVRFLERRLRLESALAASPEPDAAVLRPALVDVLDALEVVADDELLWQQALLGAASLTAGVLAHLDELVDDRLPALLVLAGYLPPPPVDAVVDGVAAALAEARGHVAAGSPEAAVAGARAALREFVRTARDRTAPDAGARTAVRVLRHWARRTARLAEQLVPAVVGGAVAAVIGHRMGSPGVDVLEVLGFATATKATERLMELTAASVLVLGRGPATAVPQAPDPVQDAQRALARLGRSLDAVPASVDALPATSAPFVRRLEAGLLAEGQRAAVRRRAREAQRDLAVLELAARRAGSGLSDARAVRAALDALAEVGTPGDLADRAAEVRRAGRRLRTNASTTLMLAARRAGRDDPRRA